MDHSINEEELYLNTIILKCSEIPNNKLYKEYANYITTVYIISVSQVIYEVIII